MTRRPHSRTHRTRQGVLVSPSLESSRCSKNKGSSSFFNCTCGANLSLYCSANRPDSVFNDSSNMTIYFFLRERDHRVRIVIKVPHRTLPSEYFCLPLNMLEILRQGSCLQLCRRRRAGTELVLWATLKFTTIESRYFILFRGRVLSNSVIQAWLHSSAHSWLCAPKIRADPLTTSVTMKWKMKRSFLAGESDHYYSFILRSNSIQPNYR